MSAVQSATVQLLEGVRRLAESSLPLPDPGDDGALLEVEACGLCGTDLEQYRGTLPGSYPLIPGHEPVGRVVRLGAAAAARWSVNEGDRVAVEALLACGYCAPCRGGFGTRCRNYGTQKGYGLTPVAVEPGLWGAYATHLYMPSAAGLLPVPEKLQPDIATWFNPLGAGVRWAVKAPRLQLGETVAILGAGQRGLCSVIAARRAGAGAVLVTGLARDWKKLEMARELGADFAVTVPDEDPAAVLRSETGGLAHVVVDVTADAPEALAQAVACAAPGARVVLAGTKKFQEPPGFLPDMVVFKELSLQGVLGVDRASYEMALGIIRDDPSLFEALHTATLPLDRAAEALGMMESGDALHLALRP